LAQLDGTPLPKHLPGDRLMLYHPADDRALRAPSGAQVAQITFEEAAPPELETLEAVSHQLAMLPDSAGAYTSDSGPEAPSSPVSATSSAASPTSSSWSQDDSLRYDVPPSGRSSFISDPGELSPGLFDSRIASPDAMGAECPLSLAQQDTSELNSSLGSSLPLEDFAFQSASLESLLPSDDLASHSLDSLHSGSPASIAAPDPESSALTAADKRPASRNPSDLSVGWLPLRHSKRSRHQHQQDPLACDTTPPEATFHDPGGQESEPHSGAHTYMDEAEGA
ncbi:hypothetical protein H4R35_007514, partial [Dimargaris xerosporica]